MQRLTGLDAGFLYMETPTLLMHTLKVMVLDPLGPDGADVDESLYDGLSRRLHLVPLLRRRLLEVPFGLHHPCWIEDPDFNLAYHLHHRVVPAPGTQAQMDEIIADIAGKPLDRKRPLWELWVLTGLEDDALAVLVKIHHAMADGVAATRLLTNVMSSEPSEADPALPSSPWTPDSEPLLREVIRHAIADRLRHLVHVPQLVRKTGQNLLHVARDRRKSQVTTPTPVLDTPRTSFNGALTPRRSFATLSFPLAEAKEVKRAFGVTLNAVVLALVSGALRKYLGDRGELPTKPLVASVPMSAEEDGDSERLSGNKLSNMFATLATHVADPGERLQAIHVVAAEAKHLQGLLGVELMTEWVEYAPPRLYSWAVRQWSKRHLADFFPPPVNLIVSNVPGPRGTLYAPGHRLRAIYSVGPVLEGIGLNITMWSYLDQMHVGVLACREMVPDPHRITEALQEALAELLALAR